MVEGAFCPVIKYGQVAELVDAVYRNESAGYKCNRPGLNPGWPNTKEVMHTVTKENVSKGG